MTTPLRRRRLATVLAAGALVAGGLLAGAPVQAATGNLNYSCDLPAPIPDQTFVFTMDTNAPAKMYVGRSGTPKLAMSVKIPDNIIQIAKFFQVTAVSGEIDATVLINNVATVVHGSIPRTTIPDGPFVARGTTTLPKLNATKLGSVVYKPGNLVFSLTAYKGEEVYAQINDLPCTRTSPAVPVDTVQFVKSPTKTAGKLATVPGKKVRATATVTATSGIVPVGTAMAKVFRGKKLLATRTATLTNGAVSAVFPKPAKKGTYKVVISYGGSKAHLGSSTSKTFRIR